MHQCHVRTWQIERQVGGRLQTEVDGVRQRITERLRHHAARALDYVDVRFHFDLALVEQLRKRLIACAFRPIAEARHETTRRQLGLRSHERRFDQALRIEHRVVRLRTQCATERRHLTPSPAGAQ
ncbi:hypothetical protein FZN37_004402 [Enterobacter hormaechei]|nr:hypothetical protein FZN37_004402 [Enterobacter hormaechei]